MSEGDGTPLPGSPADPATALVRLPDDVLLQHVADETVLLHLTRGEYFGLDPIGTRMLDLALARADAPSVVAALHEEYDAPPERLARDLERLLAELAGAGLVERTGAAADVGAGLEGGRGTGGAAGGA